MNAGAYVLEALDRRPDPAGPDGLDRARGLPAACRTGPVRPPPRRLLDGHRHPRALPAGELGHPRAPGETGAARAGRRRRRPGRGGRPGRRRGRGRRRRRWSRTAARSRRRRGGGPACRAGRRVAASARRPLSRGVGRLGDGCRVGAGAAIEDAILAAGVEVGEGARVASGAVIGEGAQIGPGAAVRRGRVPAGDPGEERRRRATRSTRRSAPSTRAASSTTSSPSRTTSATRSGGSSRPRTRALRGDGASSSAGWAARRSAASSRAPPSATACTSRWLTVRDYELPAVDPARPRGALLELLGRHRGDARLLRRRRGAWRPAHRRDHRRGSSPRRPAGPRSR